MGKKKTPTKPKLPPKYYSIGEWFGSDIISMSANQRRSNAALAISKKVKQRPCPFREGRMCNKAGGVCSLRQYQREGDTAEITLGKLVTTCPSRFFDANEVFRWVGEEILGTKAPRVIGEIPFLENSERRSRKRETMSRERGISSGGLTIFLSTQIRVQVWSGVRWRCRRCISPGVRWLTNSEILRSIPSHFGFQRKSGILILEAAVPNVCCRNFKQKSRR